MTTIKELEEAFEETLIKSNESEEFKRRFVKLIAESVENASKQVYSNEDLKEVIALIKLEEDNINESQDIKDKIQKY